MSLRVWTPPRSPPGCPQRCAPPVRASWRSTDGAVSVAPKGMPLSQLLRAVTAAVADAFREGVWTVVDATALSALDHIYLEVAERDGQGSVVAKARAMIWSRVAAKILPEFESTTGMQLAVSAPLITMLPLTGHQRPPRPIRGQSKALCSKSP